jgi:prevent-host-death family protein
MPFATAKDLRTRTKQLLQMVRGGERVVITLRGRPVAVMSPATRAPDALEDVRSFDEAWPDIVRTLRKTRPAFATPEAALRASRRRR